MASPSIETSALSGCKIMLVGDSGTGKTTSLLTLLEAGLEVFVIATEPGYSVLYDKPNSKLHVMYSKPSYGDMSTLLQSAKNTASMTYDGLSKQQDPTRSANNRFVPLLQGLMQFKDDRSGELFGNAGTWGTDRALVIDSFSGLCEAVMSMVVGMRPVVALPEYQVAQKQAYALIQQICYDFRCHFVLISHAERETDEVNGGSKIMAQGIGKKLAPQLPKIFDDVVLTVRNGTEFSWDTANSQAQLKTRNLAISAKLPPSFQPIIESWKRRGGKFEASVATPSNVSVLQPR